jgi:hypothetical protein
MGDKKTGHKQTCDRNTGDRKTGGRKTGARKKAKYIVDTEGSHDRRKAVRQSEGSQPTDRQKVVKS